MKGHRVGLFLLALVFVPSADAAPAPKVEELRIQKVGDTTYFHVRFEMPRHLREEDERVGRTGSRTTAASLVSPDGKAQRIFPRRPLLGGQVERDAPDDRVPGRQPPMARQSVPVQGLEFVGKVRDVGAIQLTLLYPRTSRLARLRSGQRDARLVWEEATIALDPSKARDVALPDEVRVRRAGPVPKKNVEHPVRDDLEGLWAAAQVDHFAALASQVSDFGFHHLASEATARKYNVPRLLVNAGWRGEERRFGGGPGLAGAADLRDLYDMTTGASAIAESLAMRRLLATGLLDTGNRTVDIVKMQGIDIEEHPWEKMMAGKKPADEPLARLIPHDNYYVSFRSIRKFNELGDLMDQWGTSLQQATQPNSRDYRIKERYEQQLCLRSTTLGRTLGPFVIKGLAVTGNDGYLREGSDITIVFHVNNKALFLAGVDGFLKEAREKFGATLKESKTSHNDIAIESFVTPLREVSAHRCTFGEYVVYSNSLPGLKRVLDAHQGKIKRLSEALDFQYMRTIFRADDRSEDGFAFMSDAFIRQLVGPASKIKEKRRVEALTSLYTITNGALFTAWETGKKPAAHREVMAGANLKPHETPVPEGKPAVWDDTKQLAFSDAYNTIHFATPLVELPADKATEAESQQYERFRLEYLGLWRQYFDPIGVRFRLTPGEVKVDTYILPLIQNSQYNEMRRLTAGGTIGYDAGRISSTSLLQFMLHLSPGVQLRERLFGLGRGRGEAFDPLTLLGLGLGPIGKWAMLRVDDSEVYAKLAGLIEKSDRGEDVDTLEIARLVFEMPVLVGVDIKNSLTFGAALAVARLSVLSALPGGITWEPLEKPYKGVQIVRIQATGNTVRDLVGPVVRGRRAGKPFEPSLYYAMLDGGFHLSFNEKMLKDFIDEAEARKKGEAKIVEVNTSLYLSPGAAKLSGVLLRKYLEDQIHDQAMENLPVLQTLHGCGILPEKPGVEQARAAHLYLGYVPVSPDGSGYQHDAARGEMSNDRHGSLRKPTPKKDLAEGSPLARLLEELRSARADLRFREDGIHTVLTIERNKNK